MSPEEMIARLEAPLSRRRRIGYVVLALAGLTGAGLIGVLWATEPALPTRTAVAFGVLVSIGLGWAAYGGWALTRRTPLFALDRVVAAWLAAVATGLFTAGSLAIAMARDRVSVPLVGLTLVLWTVAVLNLARARSRRAELLRRRRELGGGPR